MCPVYFVNDVTGLHPPRSLYVAEFKLSAPARLWSLTLARAKIVGESGAARSFLLF